jgi:hypothetical protein
MPQPKMRQPKIGDGAYLVLTGCAGCGNGAPAFLSAIDDKE